MPKGKIPFFFTLKSLSNKQQLFFYFIDTLKGVAVKITGLEIKYNGLLSDFGFCNLLLIPLKCM